MSELRLAAVNGEQTEAPDATRVLSMLEGLAETIRDGSAKVEKIIVVMQSEGRVDWTCAALDRLTLAEATGLLALASRAIERHIRGE